MSFKNQEGSKDLSSLRNIVVLTGAGISAESGIKTFRDHNGLWENHSIEEVATPQAFRNNPDLVYKFYNQRRAQLSEVEPNAAHRALADLEASLTQQGKRFLLITQNVDDLHQRAGSKNILPMHGELKKARCLETHEVFDWPSELDARSLHPRSKLPGKLRPHICWFYEEPFFMNEIFKSVKEADLFLVIGTSNQVYPASHLVRHTPDPCYKVLLNKEPTSMDDDFDQVILGPASVEVPRFLALFSAGVTSV